MALQCNWQFQGQPCSARSTRRKTRTRRSSSRLVRLPNRCIFRPRKLAWKRSEYAWLSVLGHRGFHHQPNAQHNMRNHPTACKRLFSLVHNVMCGQNADTCPLKGQGTLRLMGESSHRKTTIRVLFRERSFASGQIEKVSSS